MNKNILYVRCGANKVNISKYNLQEIGFAEELCNKGYSCDILYYSDKNNDEVIFKNNESEVKVLWRKGIKVLRTGIYPQILNRKFLDKYEHIIVTDYSQIMTLLLSLYSSKVICYHGPYYNLFRFKLMEKIYDILFNKIINRNVKYKLAKSDLAKSFIEEKGFSNIYTIGVGLDTRKFKHNEKPDKKILEILNRVKDNDYLLYVGSLDERKSLDFTLKVFAEVKKKRQNLMLVLIGKGKEEYIEKCFSEIDDSNLESIIRIDEIDNSMLKYIYEKAKAFLLPSKQEIFGMVLLEAMYFGVPTITTVNGGSTTIIKNEVNGIIKDNFDILDWSTNIEKLLENDEYRKNISLNATKSIKDNFTWDKISEKFLNIVNENSDGI